MKTTNDMTFAEMAEAEIIEPENKLDLARKASRRATGRELADMARSTNRDSFDFDDCIFPAGEWTDDEIVEVLVRYARDEIEVSEWAN